MKKARQYRYSLKITQRTAQIESADPPNVFLRNLQEYTHLYGCDWDKLPLVISVCEDGEAVWQRIDGVQETSQLSLFPTLDYDEKNTLNEEAYHEIGQKALNAYRVICDNWNQIHASGRVRKDESAQSILADLRDKMQNIENTVVDVGEFEKLFRLKYVRREPIKTCARELHIAERTVNRKYRR